MSGAVSFEVEIRDPDAGSANGAGIAAVDLSILQPIQDPFILLASTTLSTPPYTWLFDTSALRDEKHFFGVTATAVDGGVRSVLVPILVDNGTGNAPPAIHGLTHAVPVPLVDRSGRALVGARIAASCRGRELLAISDGEGRASLAFDAATPGAAIRFGGTAGAAGFAAQRFEALAAEGRELLIWNEGQSQAGHAVVLDPAVAVHGIVVDARGLPAAGVRIEVSLGAGARAYGCEPGPFCSTVWTAETDVAGGYAIEGLPAGRPDTLGARAARWPTTGGGAVDPRLRRRAARLEPETRFRSCP